MKLIFIGSGSAFTVGNNNYHSNMLLEAPSGKHLLIDCGSDARLALSALNYDFHDIDAVYISHLHADHAGGLEWLGLSRKANSTHKLKKPVLHIAAAMVHKLWQHTLSGGMRSLETENATLESYFTVKPIKPHSYFVWEKIRFYVIPMEHIMHGTEHVPSFGLFFHINQQTIFITTDNKFSPKVNMPYYLKADLIFQDCETAPVPSGVHSHFHELITLPENIKQKMWLYHYNSGSLPDAKKNGFKGFVRRGQSFLI